MSCCVQNSRELLHSGEPGRVGSTDTGSNQSRERTAIMAAAKPMRFARPSHWTLEECLSAYSVPEPNSGCLLWERYVSADGYGVLRWNGKVQKAHRLAWQSQKGSIPSGMLVCHKCDVPSCINPSHMFLGRDADNSDDKVAKGRQARVRGERQPKAKLTERDIPVIRADSRILREIAKDFGVSVGLIFFIKKRRAWAHVP